MENIYNAIQNVYNMDKTTWQEVLAELYNLVSKVENKFDLFENKFGSLLGEEVTIELKKMYDDGSLAALINDKILKDINTKVDAFKTEVSEQLDNIITTKFSSVFIFDYDRTGEKDESINLQNTINSLKNNVLNNNLTDNIKFIIKGGILRLNNKVTVPPYIHIYADGLLI